MDFHPIAAIFPILPDSEIDALVASIKADGLQHPIVTFEGKILDGRNRYLACQRAGVEPILKPWTGSHLEAVAFVWRENRLRRQLNSSQAAACAIKREQIETEYRAAVEAEREAARDRQRAAGGDRRSAAAKRASEDRADLLAMAEAENEPGDTVPWEELKQEPLSQTIGQAIQDPHNRRASAKQAAAAGTNRKYIDDARTIATRAPEKLEEVARGEKTIPQALREIRKAEVKEVVQLPSNKYRVLYADPPWHYGNSGIIGETDSYGHVERYYQTMTIAELCAMDVKSIVEDNAVLFLWVTSPLLAECWPVITAWGFKYKSSFIWDKIKHNFGHYNSVRHEILLICTRGSCTPDVPELIDSVQSIERSDRHSEKPEEFRAIIDKLYPHGKRIELFARRNTEGWDSFGNEI